MSKTFEEILQEIKEHYTFHRKEADKYKALLDAAGIDVDSNKNRLHKNIVSSKLFELLPTPKNTNNGKATFETYIINILQKEGQPLATKELQDKFQSVTGMGFSNKNFSSKLSIASKNKKIKNMKFEDFPLTERYWWGLVQWFAGDKLKDEYVKTIVERVDVKA